MSRKSQQIQRYTAEEAFPEFVQHLPTMLLAQGSNEATTRLRSIDLLLFDV